MSRKNKDPLYVDINDSDLTDADTLGYYTDPFAKNLRNLNNLKKKLKKLKGGKSNFMASYKHKKPKTKKLHPGSKVPTNDDVKAPNGTKWKNQTGHVKQREWDFENTDVFSDFDGNFFLEKVGNHFHCWIQIVSANVINGYGDFGPASSKAHNLKICEKTWDDPDGKRSFALSSIAAYFAKHNITEDMPAKNGAPHVYHDIDMGCGAVKYWNILDGGYNSGKKPHKIAHAGETIVIDTARLKVYKTDGTDLTKYTSFGSIFPPLYGNQINNVDFSPTVGTECDVNVQYVPRIK